MNDILRSLQRAAARDGWIFDDRWQRIGSPFAWIDGEQMPLGMFQEDVYAVLQYISMFYEEYGTPEGIRTDDHDEVVADLEELVRRLVTHLFPHLADDPRTANHIRCTALTRAQDLGAIRTFCRHLPPSPVHLDIGPGLGSHAFYSIRHLRGRYLGLEASPHSYAIQRHVLRFLAEGRADHLDPILIEGLGGEIEVARHAIATSEKPFTQVPSWHASAIPNESVDLVTATFVLNEVGPAGITWLLLHSVRSLRTGGYVYLRDSARLKPNRHPIDYDAALGELGFESAGRLDVQNRVDMFGVPRAWRKVESVDLGTFDELFNRFFGRMASTSHEGVYMQNLPTAT